MKKKIFISILILFSSFLYSKDFSLPKNSSIIISENASVTEKYAAQILQTYIQKFTHKNIKINKDSNKKSAFEILVGKTNRINYPDEIITENSYRIKSYDYNDSKKKKFFTDGIYIIGGGNRGIIYGVFRFLEEFCGYKFFSISQGMITSQTKFSFPTEIDITYDAYFEYTETDWLSPRDVTYSLANGLNGGECRKIPEEQGGCIEFLSSFCHTLTNDFCSKDKYFSEHPEYFALVNKRRRPSQLCLTNPDVFDIVLNEVLELLKEKHNPDASMQIISLTQADNSGYCQCKECSKIDKENKSHSGTMIYFANKIADAVKKEGYDNVFIDTFAYTYTRKPPEVIKPNDNLIIRLCTIECCFSHPLTDPKCEQNAQFIKDLEDWHRLSNHLYIWDYTNNYLHTVGLFPNLNVIQKNIQCFYEHGVKGVYEEGNYYINECNSEFGELKAYLISKCLQNPYCNFEEEKTLFLKVFYGDKYKLISEFLDIICENAAKNHLGIYQGMKKTLTLTENQIKKCDQLWKKAKIGNSEFVQQNILRSELSWRYWKYCNNKSEFSNPDTYSEYEKILLNDLKKFGVTRFKE